MCGPDPDELLLQVPRDGTIAVHEDLDGFPERHGGQLVNLDKNKYSLHWVLRPAPRLKGRARYTIE